MRNAYFSNATVRNVPAIAGNDSIGGCFASLADAADAMVSCWLWIWVRIDARCYILPNLDSVKLIYDVVNKFNNTKIFYVFYLQI